MSDPATDASSFQLAPNILEEDLESASILPAMAAEPSHYCPPSIPALIFAAFS